MAARSISRAMLVAALTVMTLAQNIMLSRTADAAGNDPVPIVVSVTSKDRVGTNLAHRVREQFRASAGFRLVEQETAAVWVVRLITLARNDDQTLTVYAVIWTVNDLYMHSIVGICGANRTDSCATTIIAKTDKLDAEVAATVPDQSGNASKPQSRPAF
jgi:hypothetical protein